MYQHALDQLMRRKPDEKVVFFLRRHWLVFGANAAMIGLLAIVPFGAYLAATRVATDAAPLSGPVAHPAIVLLASAYYLLLWLFLMSAFVDYYLDAWIVTDERIVNVEQHDLFSRTVSELDLANVQDVTSDVRGFFPSIFGYGDVYVQTSGEKERFIFEQVPRPDEIRKRLLELAEADRGGDVDEKT